MILADTSPLVGLLDEDDDHHAACLAAAKILPAGPLLTTWPCRMAMLMTQYRDVPMDLADASLVAIAESHGFRRLFTVDSDFYFYQSANGSMLEVVR